MEGNAERNSPRPKVWAIGGGKGGVGKSVITANLAVTLARSGRKCVLLDADLGGGNLHTLLGVSHRGKSLADIFSHRANSLSEILLPTPIPGLQLISGAQPLFTMANPHHQQKLKILRQVHALETEYVLIDLGAGSAFNVLDFFLPAHRKLVVLSPTPTAVENAYHFLKAAYFRNLRLAARGAGLSDCLDRLLGSSELSRSPPKLARELEATGGKKANILARGLNYFSLDIIVNQTRDKMDERLGVQIANAASAYFETKIAALGTICNDDHVYRAVQKRTPVLEAFPHSPFSNAIRRICQNLIPE